MCANASTTISHDSFELAHERLINGWPTLAAWLAEEHETFVARFGPDEVGAHAASTGPFGLIDTSGNVWEIVRARDGSGYVTRGGCYYTSNTTAHLANRQAFPPTYRHVLTGVRICADAP